MDDLALLRLEMETLWVTDRAGALLHCRTAGAEPPPLLVVGSGALGMTCATSVDVPPVLGARLAALLHGEPPADAIGWAPRCAAALVEALAEVGEVAAPRSGPSYVVPHRPVAPTGVDLRSSTEADLRSLHDLMPEADRSLTAPWAVAMVDGRVAAVCETARSAPTAVEAGVWTYEPHRRRGLGTAVTAAWSALVAPRTAFYSTSSDNAASQGVARCLGLRPLGHWWQLSRSGVARTD